MEAKAVTFQFSKHVKKPTVLHTLLSVTENKEDVDFVKAVDGSGIESTKKRKEAAGPLVIPLKKPRLKQKQNADGKIYPPNNGNEATEMSIEEQNLEKAAAEELMQETSDAAEGLNKSREVEDISMPSSTIVQGAIIGEVPSLSNYEDVPVKEFGKALLRGMGWKEADDVEKNGVVVTPFEAVVRPKGLGLGASAAAATQSARPAAEGDEPLDMVPGACVVVACGKEKGLYGQVSSLDGEGRALVKMAISERTSSLPEGTLQLVTKKEYRRNSKVLNQKKYNEYRDKQEKQSEVLQGSGSESRRAEGRPEDRSSKHSDRDGKTKSSGSDDRAGGERRADTRPWARPMLRVRCVDDKYKKGRYYKEKITVVDVITTELCICSDSSGRLLEDVPTASLETVVPRQRPAHVMVVRGQHRGQVGEVIEWDRRRCSATVQLLPDSELCRLDYDDICEYTGSMDAFS